MAKLRLLELTSGVDEPALSFALNHPQPAVRQNAVRLAEPKLATNTTLRDVLLKLADDPDPQVRFQVALSLGEARLYHIVIPEAEIAPNFVNYECELKDGRTLSGLLASENFGNIGLRLAQGVEENIARTQIVRLTVSRLSLMPQELEKSITAQELADLLAYLKGEE